MMKRVLVSALALVGASLLGVPSNADNCSSPGLWCLFVDATGCAVSCGEGVCCRVETASCAFGFGFDATCTCVPCLRSPAPVIIIVPD